MEKKTRNLFTVFFNKKRRKDDLSYILKEVIVGIQSFEVLHGKKIQGQVFLL